LGAIIGAPVRGWRCASASNSQRRRRRRRSRGGGCAGNSRGYHRRAGNWTKYRRSSTCRRYSGATEVAACCSCTGSTSDNNNDGGTVINNYYYDDDGDNISISIDGDNLHRSGTSSNGNNITHRRLGGDGGEQRGRHPSCRWERRRRGAGERAVPTSGRATRHHSDSGAGGR